MKTEDLGYHCIFSSRMLLLDSTPALQPELWQGGGEAGEWARQQTVNWRGVTDIYAKYCTAVLPPDNKNDKSIRGDENLKCCKEISNCS